MGMEQIRTKQMMKQEKEESRNEGGIWRTEFGNKAKGDQKNGRRRKHWNWGTEIRTKQIMKEKEESRN